MKTMKLRIDREGFIYNEQNVVIAVLTPDATQEDERTIELGSEAVPLVMGFIDDVNSGTLKPRTAVKKFEALLEKYKI